MEGKGVYTILLAIIAVLTLALALLVVFLFVTWGPNQGKETNLEDKMIKERLVPFDEQEEFHILKEDEPFTLRSEPEHPDAVILIQMSIMCDMGEKRRNEEKVTKLVSRYNSQLKEALSNYLALTSYTEAKLPEIKYKAKDDLKVKFNEILNQNEREKEIIVYEVIFSNWFTTD